VSKNDKSLELARYELRAKSLWLSGLKNNLKVGSLGVPLPIRAPYEAYESLICKLPGSGKYALEIGAGMGEFTEVLLKNYSHVYATDISEASLSILKNIYSEYKGLRILVGDMEALPFDDEAFDLVSCAGSLSYGDNNLVLKEVYRVLRPGGYFMAVDVLDHNPIYKLNRLLHFIKDQRTWSVVNRAPTNKLLAKYSQMFEVQITYYGSLVWVIPFLKVFFSDATVKKFIDLFDRIINVENSAFKFVICAKK
jgi:ubiquinone/menaquinone biosynthesis C-methylase UbiE